MALTPRALTTLKTVKEELKIDTGNTDNDSLLERYINSVSDFIQSPGVMDRELGKSTYTSEKHVGSDDVWFYTNHWPILSVTEIILDEDILDETNEDYELLTQELSKGRIYREDLWLSTGPRRGTTGDRWRVNTLNVEITYVAGYVLPQDDGAPDPRTLPYDIEELVIRLVAQRFALYCGSAHGKVNYKVGSRTITWDKLISDGDWEVIQKYARIEVV